MIAHHASELERDRPHIRRKSRIKKPPNSCTLLTLRRVHWNTCFDENVTDTLRLQHVSLPWQFYFNHLERGFVAKVSWDKFKPRQPNENQRPSKKNLTKSSGLSFVQKWKTGLMVNILVKRTWHLNKITFQLFPTWQWLLLNCSQSAEEKVKSPLLNFHSSKAKIFAEKGD